MKTPKPIKWTFFRKHRFNPKPGGVFFKKTDFSTVNRDLPFFRWWKNATDAVDASVVLHGLDVADRLLELLGPRPIRPSVSYPCTSERRGPTTRWWRYLEECSCNGFTVICIRHGTLATCVIITYCTFSRQN